MWTCPSCMAMPVSSWLGSTRGARGGRLPRQLGSTGTGTQSALSVPGLFREQDFWPHRCWVTASTSPACPSRCSSGEEPPDASVDASFEHRANHLGLYKD